MVSVRRRSRYPSDRVFSDREFSFRIRLFQLGHFQTGHVSRAYAAPHFLSRLRKPLRRIRSALSPPIPSNPRNAWIDRLTLVKEDLQ
jgi:hypothetical protein